MCCRACESRCHHAFTGTFARCEYKAIISDIDGTIAPLTWHSKVSAQVKKSIQQVQAKGIKFCLATGKPFSLVEHLINELELSSPLIVDNGTGIYDASTKEVMWESTMKVEEMRPILEICQTYNKRIRISDGRNPFDFTGSIPESAHFKKIVIMSIAKPDAEELIAKVENEYKNLAVTRAQSYEGEDFLDIYITNAEGTKQHAIVKLAEILQISTSEMIGIGDHYNDFPLLMACGLKVAMGNAVPELKAIADYIAPSVEEEGVVDVIEKFVLNGKS